MSEVGKLRALRHTCGEMMHVFVIQDNPDGSQYRTFAGCPKCGSKSKILISNRSWEDPNLKTAEELQAKQNEQPAGLRRKDT